MTHTKAACFLPLFFLLSALGPAYTAAIDWAQQGQITESELSRQSGTTLLLSGILPLQPPLTLERSLDDLESLLDSWETDSLMLLRELVELQTIAEELKSTLTALETRSEALSYSLVIEQSKTLSLSRQIKALWIGGAIVAVLAFSGGLALGLSR